MRGIKSLKIVFDSNTGVFSPGDVVSGQIIIQVDSTHDQEGLKNVQGRVNFRGKAKTKWTTVEHTDGESGGPSTHTVTHSQKEKYFNTKSSIFGEGSQPDSADDKLNIPPGTHAYPFSFQLPNVMLPASFEQKHGYVRYKVKVTLSLIGSKSNKSFKKMKLFSVIGPMVDLNTMLELQSGVKKTEELFNCCGCGSTVEESITISLPKQGYVPGESLYLTGQVDNRDREEFCTFYCKLIQKITLHSTSQEKSVEKELGHAGSRVATPRGRVTDFSLDPILIPPVPPSGLPGCSIIDLQYYMQCQWKYKVKCTFPITIGTVSLPGSFPTAPPANTLYPSADVTAPGLPVGVDAYAPAFDGEASPPNYQEAPPPSYEQAVGQIDRLTNERIDEDYFPDDQFVPSYPYYNYSVDVPPDSR